MGTEEIIPYFAAGFVVGAPAFMRGKERFSAPGKGLNLDHALVAIPGLQSVRDDSVDDVEERMLVYLTSVLV